MNGNAEAGAGFAQDVDAMTLARAQRGDMQAFAMLYRQFGKACFNLGLRVLGSRAQAEDLVQEVFLKMMGNIRSYRGDAPFGAWLKRSTVNAAIDQLRSLSRVAGGEAEAVIEQTVFDSGSAPAVGVDAWSLLARLPARARAIVVLHEIEGYTHAELAQMFRQSESYSKSILARGLKRLNELVQSTPASIEVH